MQFLTGSLNRQIVVLIVGTKEMNLFRMNNDIHKFLSFRYISGAYVEIFGEGIQICAFGCCGGYFSRN